MSNLNLLTTKKKQQLTIERQYRRGRNIVFMFVGLIAMYAVVLLASKIMLTSRLEQLQGDVATEEEKRSAQEDAPITQTIRDLNASLAEVASIQEDYTDWVDFLIALSNTVPPNVRIENLDIRKATGTVQIKGFALTREDLITFKQNLNDSDLFLGDIVSPISNLIQREDITFEFDAEIEPTDVISNRSSGSPDTSS